MSNQDFVTGSRHQLAGLPPKVEVHPAPGAEPQRPFKLPEELAVEEADLAPPKILYNAVLLFLPYFYSSRAYPVLKSAKLAEEEIRSSFATAASGDEYHIITLKRWPYVKLAWNEFLDSLRNEWNTLNVVSALLLTAIYNVLLLGGQGSTLTQCTALMSLISALMSLTLGCLYLIRFETMRRTYKAIQWSSDALKTSRIVLWNIYTLLALPAAWLAWSLIFFVVCLMSIVWQPIDMTIGSASGLGPLHLASKIVATALLFAGMVHLSFALFVFAGYGSRLDMSWSKKLENFMLVESVPGPSDSGHQAINVIDTRIPKPISREVNDQSVPVPNDSSHQEETDANKARMFGNSLDFQIVPGPSDSGHQRNRDVNNAPMFGNSLDFRSGASDSMNYAITERLNTIRNKKIGS